MTINSDMLQPGERFLWRDKPDVDAYCERRTPIGFFVGFGLLAVGSAVAAYGYLHGDADSTAVFGAVMALVGAALLYLPFRVRREARRTIYALTDRRAIIEAPGALLHSRISVPFSEIRLIEVRHDIFGDILFRDYVGQSEEGFQVTRDGFFAIADVQKVERLLRSAVAKASGKPVTGGAE
jgi:hypothetical protein